MNNFKEITQKQLESAVILFEGSNTFKITKNKMNIISMSKNGVFVRNFRSLKILNNHLKYSE
jgi:hypothetical protein